MAVVGGMIWVTREARYVVDDDDDERVRRGHWPGSPPAVVVLLNITGAAGGEAEGVDDNLSVVKV